MQSRWLLPGEGSSAISYHPSQSIDHDSFAYLGWILSDWDNLIHLYLQDSGWMIQSANALLADEPGTAQFGEVVYFIYDARQSTPKLPESVDFLDDFHLCQRQEHEDGSVIELYLKREFSCALVAASNPFQVDYDNGARLENLLTETGQDDLVVQFMWSNLPSEPHSVSLQVFDAAGDKVLGQDSTIGHNSLRRQLVDIASLPPGEYTVKLIVYNFNTGRSVSGKISATSVTFDRELEIATIKRE